MTRHRPAHLARAVAEHRRTKRARRDRSAELRELESRVWTRAFRRLDDVELTARELRALERDRRRREEPARESLPA